MPKTEKIAGEWIAVKWMKKRKDFKPSVQVVSFMGLFLEFNKLKFTSKNLDKAFDAYRWYKYSPHEITKSYLVSLNDALELGY